MESLFPALLTFSFFAPLLLRIGVAAVFFGIAQSSWKARKLEGSAVGVLGILFLVGAFTQAAAVASLLYLGWSLMRENGPNTLKPKTIVLFLTLALLSLLLTGPGAIAFDKPY